MKKLFISAICLIAFTALYAQDCTTVWPYLYPDFTEGAVNRTSGKTTNYKLNVHVKESKLHFFFLNHENEAYLTDVASVRIGDDIYIPVNQKLMRVAAQEGDAYVLELKIADLSNLNETGGAYGTSSSTSATNKLSSIETDAQINHNHMLLKASRDNGDTIELESTYYFYINGELTEASIREVDKKIAPEDKASWKQFKKENKLKWNQEESLVKILSFLNSTH